MDTWFASTLRGEGPTPPLPAAPESQRRISVRLSTLVLLALLCVSWGLGAVELVQERGSIAHIRRDIARSEGTERDLRAILDRLQVDETTLESRVDGIFDPAAVVRGARSSVFTLIAGRWQGSAFVLSSSGGTADLVTNYHVVRAVWTAGVRRVVVRNAGGSFNATVVRVFPGSDVALIKADRSLVPLDPDEASLAPGQPVVVLGSPYGFGGSVSTGVVSAVRHRYLQFSAPVSPGSSGGPVLDAQGRVIGIATAKMTGPGAEGLSFAIPIDRVCRLSVAC